MNDLLKEKIINKKAIINVIGLGYVGLPLALSFAESGDYVMEPVWIDKKVIPINQLDNASNDAVKQSLGF